MDNDAHDSPPADEGTHTDHSAPRPRDRELLGVGEHIGRYRVIEPLGAGGMGAVYRAHDPDLTRDVAIKVLHSAEPGTPPAADHEKRLLREAQAMARLSHPNIVTVYDVGTFRGRVFIAMEWVDGGTLKSWLRGGQPWRARLEAVLAAGRGLSEAHRAGVVHRDFKPDNVLVSKKGQVQVVDFGLARSAGDADLDLDDAGALALRSPDGDALDLQLTRTGAVIGTPAYMAPEQFHGQVATARSDQFSFAVVAFEALYGMRPFAGVTAGEVMQSVSRGACTAPAASEVPAAILRALRRGLDADPRERYPDIDALMGALADAATARPPRSAMPWIAAGLVVLALVTSGAAYLATRGDDAATVDVEARPRPAPVPHPPPPPPPPERERRIDDFIDRSLESGEVRDAERALDGLDEALKREILREVRREMGKPEDGDELGNRIKRRVLELIESAADSGGER